MLELVVATSNPHKVEEIRAVLDGVAGLRVLGLDDVVREKPGLVLKEPEEIGTTFEQNATIKALSYAEQTGRLCLADDSGLEVDALGGRPGVISSHYCTDGREAGMSRAERDAKNNERVMRELEGVAAEKRTARFVCVMVVAGSLGPVGLGASSPQHSQGGSDQPYLGDFRIHTGKLPHWQVGGATYFVTFRLLAGTMDERERAIALNACRFWDGKKIVLHSVVVMPDHVHLLFRTKQQADGAWPMIETILHSIKSFSANEINKGRHASGQVWQTEYFDRIMRHATETEEAKAYIEMNAVRAGLATMPGDYPFLHRQATRSPECEGLEAPHPARSRNGRPAPTTILFTARGNFGGRIGLASDVPRGVNGFGYDPLFLVAADGFKRTGAELSPEEKNRLSHRGMALREVAKWIQSSHRQ